MKDIAIGFICVNALFALCFITAYVIVTTVSFIKAPKLKTSNNKRLRKRADKEAIYYLSKAPERPVRKRQKPPIAIKGTLLTDEQLDRLLKK